MLSKLLRIIDRQTVEWKSIRWKKSTIARKNYIRSVAVEARKIIVRLRNETLNAKRKNWLKLLQLQASNSHGKTSAKRCRHWLSDLYNQTWNAILISSRRNKIKVITLKNRIEKRTKRTRHFEISDEDIVLATQILLLARNMKSMINVMNNMPIEFDNTWNVSSEKTIGVNNTIRVWNNNKW